MAVKEVIVKKVTYDTKMCGEFSVEQFRDIKETLKATIVSNYCRVEHYTKKGITGFRMEFAKDELERTKRAYEAFTGMSAQDEIFQFNARRGFGGSNERV